MLDPRLQTFLVLCDTMSYTRAAKQLCLTQPAVTQHIHYLEKHYGCKLVSYQGKVLRLTPAGERLREMVRSLSYNSHKMEEALASPRPAVLHIGATKTIGEYVLGPDLGRLLREYPECTVSLTVDNTKALLEALDRGTLDFALIEGFFDKARYGHRLYRREEFFGVCAPGHPAAGRELSLDGLLAENLIVREKGSGTRAILEEWLHFHNHTVESFARVTEISDFSLIKSLVRQGLGISFLYAPVVEQELNEGSLCRLSLGASPVVHEFSLVYLPDNLFIDRWSGWLSGLSDQ